MHILTELSLIFALCLAGEGIAALLPVAFPASVISMLLLMALLLTGVVKERRIQTVSRFLVTNMGLFFIPSLVGTMEYVEVLRAQALPFLAVTFLTTPVVYLAAAWTVQLLMRRSRKTSYKKSRSISEKSVREMRENQSMARGRSCGCGWDERSM